MVLDMAGSDNREPLQDYRTLRAELKAYDPALLKRYDAAKQVVVPGAVEDVRKFAERDTALWKPLVQRLGIRND